MAFHPENAKRRFTPPASQSFSSRSPLSPKIIRGTHKQLFKIITWKGNERGGEDSAGCILFLKSSYSIETNILYLRDPTAAFSPNKLKISLDSFKPMTCLPPTAVDFPL